MIALLAYAASAAPTFEAEPITYSPTTPLEYIYGGCLLGHMLVDDPAASSLQSGSNFVIGTLGPVVSTGGGWWSRDVWVTVRGTEASPGATGLLRVQHEGVVVDVVKVPPQ